VGPLSVSSATSVAPTSAGPTALSELPTPELVDAVVRAGYAPTPLAELQLRLGRHALPKVTSSIRSGGILGHWRAAGFGTKVDAALHRHHSTEDIAQEAVMEALSDLVAKILVPGLWDPARGSLEAYFTARCVRAALNVYRRYRRARHDELVMEPEKMNNSVIYLTGNASQDPAEIICQRDVARRAFEELSKRELAALELSVDGWSNVEIADQLGISIESVRARLSRGRRRLAARFAEEDRW